MTTRIDISLGTFVRAHSMASEFNLAAANVQGRDCAVATLVKAVDVVNDISDKVKDGWEVMFGNPYSWDEVIFSADMVDGIAQNKIYENSVDRILDDAAIKNTTFLDVDDLTAQKLQRIRDVFNLASDVEACRVVVEAYNKVKTMHKHQNSLYLKKDEVHRDFIF